MTATSYVDLDNDDLGANKILRAATMSALDTNPVSIAQRGPSAPWLNGIGAITSIASGSGNWTVPSGVYRIKVMAVGEGGGSSAGADTTFGSITGGGGGARASSLIFNGGTASGGDINLLGGGGDYQDNSAGPALYVAGGYSCVGGAVGRGAAWGVAAGTGSFTAGGGGATAIKVFSVNPGDLIAYSVTGNGIIIIEY